MPSTDKFHKLPVNQLPATRLTCCASKHNIILIHHILPPLSIHNAWGLWAKSLLILPLKHKWTYGMDELVHPHRFNRFYSVYNPFHAVYILRSMPIYLRFVLLLNTEMSKRLSNFKVEQSFRTQIRRGQSFTIFYNKNFYPLLKWDLMYNIENRTEIHLTLSNLVVILDVPWSLWYKTHLSGHKLLIIQTAPNIFSL